MFKNMAWVCKQLLKITEYKQLFKNTASVCKQLLKNTVSVCKLLLKNTASVTGGELFAKRRKRAENWVVDETSIGQSKPSAFADKFMQVSSDAVVA